MGAKRLVDLAFGCLDLGLSARISNNRRSTRLSSFSEKRHIRCWSRPCVLLSIASNACSCSDIVGKPIVKPESGAHGLGMGGSVSVQEGEGDVFVMLNAALKRAA